MGIKRINRDFGQQCGQWIAWEPEFSRSITTLVKSVEVKQDIMSTLTPAQILAQGPHALKIELSAAPQGQAKLTSYLVSIPGEVKLEDVDLGTIKEAFDQAGPLSKVCRPNKIIDPSFGPAEMWNRLSQPSTARSLT